MPSTGHLVGACLWCTHRGTGTVGAPWLVHPPRYIPYTPTEQVQQHFWVLARPPAWPEPCLDHPPDGQIPPFWVFGPLWRVYWTHLDPPPMARHVGEDSPTPPRPLADFVPFFGISGKTGQKVAGFRPKFDKMAENGQKMTLFGPPNGSFFDPFLTHFWPKMVSKPHCFALKRVFRPRK